LIGLFLIRIVFYEVFILVYDFKNIRIYVKCKAGALPKLGKHPLMRARQTHFTDAAMS
jgi:hypothetical protein